MTWSELGEHEKAVADFTACILLRPRLFEAWYNRAASLADLRRFEEAVRDCDEALKLVPDHPRVLSNRGFGRLELGDTRGAILDMDASIALAPESRVYCQRARAHGTLDEWDAAVEDVERAIQLDDRNDDAWGLRAGAAIRDTRWEPAIEAADRAIALHDLPAYRRLRAQALMSLASKKPEGEKRSLLERALADVDQFLVANPQEFDSLFNRGRILAQLGRFREAITVLELALKHAPTESALLRTQAALDAVRDLGDNK
jgi:tetratricopeptide (TPR) repeat protein